MPEPIDASPTSILKQAIRAVPAVKYALGVGGIVAVIAIIVGGFKIDLKVAVLGSVIMFVLMTILVIFARLASAASVNFYLPMMVFTWFSLVLTMATALALFTSVFAGWPLDIRSLVAVRKDDPVVQSRNDSLDAQVPKKDEAKWREHVVAGNQAAADAIAFENCLLKNCEHFPDEQFPFEWQQFDAKWKIARSLWREALSETGDATRIKELNDMLTEDVGITCQKDSTSVLGCFANASSFHRLDGPDSFSVPVHPTRPH